MRSLIGCIILAITSLTASASNLVGTIKNPDGSLFNGKASWILSYPGNGYINTPIYTKIVNGTILTTNGKVPSVVGNDAITSPVGTFYYAYWYNPAGDLLVANNFYVSGTNFDVSNALVTPFTTNQISFTQLTGLTALGVTGNSTVALAINASNAFQVQNTGTGDAASFRPGSNSTGVKILDPTGVTTRHYFKGNGDAILCNGGTCTVDQLAAPSGTRTLFRQAAVSVTKSAVQNIPNAALTLVSWDQEGYDTDGLHDNVTLNSRLTASVTGKWSVWATIDWAAIATGTRECFIRKNGSVIYGHDTAPAEAAFDSGTNCKATVDLSAGDYVEVIVRHTQGGAINIQGNNRFGMELVGN